MQDSCLHLIISVNVWSFNQEQLGRSSNKQTRQIAAMIYTLCVLDPATDQTLVTLRSVEKPSHSRRFFIKQRPSVYSYVQIKGTSCQNLCCLHRTRQNKRGGGRICVDRAHLAHTHAVISRRLQWGGEGALQEKAHGWRGRGLARRARGSTLRQAHRPPLRN